MSKLRQRNEDGWYHYEFNCPGCQFKHGFYVKHEGYVGPEWDFNKDIENPTVSPSISMQTTREGKPYICHSFIRDGKIQFLPDCTHSLAGQTVELPEIESLDI
jgi:hypothetical protein